MKQLSIEQARELYTLGGRSKEIAVELFPELSERKLPKTWGEYLDMCEPEIAKYPAFACPPEMENAFSNLVKLYLLRQEYNGDWVADWKDGSQVKYCIWYDEDELQTDDTGCNSFLCFKSALICDEFASNFADLIEAAKPLLG